MVDSTISVSFSASLGDLVSGISQARDALATLGAPSQQLNAQFSNLRDSMARAFDATPLTNYGASVTEVSVLERTLAGIRAQAAEALRTGNQAAYDEAAAAAQTAIYEEVRAVQDGLKEKLAVLNDELRQHHDSESVKGCLRRCDWWRQPCHPRGADSSQ